MSRTLRAGVSSSIMRTKPSTTSDADPIRSRRDAFAVAHAAAGAPVRFHKVWLPKYSFPRVSMERPAIRVIANIAGVIDDRVEMNAIAVMKWKKVLVAMTRESHMLNCCQLNGHMPVGTP
eukprot:364397-Chlamydomonas_euryale.AAC.24